MLRESTPTSTKRSPDSNNAMLPPWATMGFGAAAEYAADFWQRSLIFLDILRRSGNQQAEMTSRPINAVPIYDSEIILRGDSLPQPVNYALVRVVPPPGTVIDNTKAPVVVIDPAPAKGRASGIQAGKRGWSGLQSETSGLRYRLRGGPGGRSNDRRCRARIYSVPGEGDRATTPRHREASGVWELPGRLACRNGRVHAPLDLVGPLVLPGSLCPTGLANAAKIRCDTAAACSVALKAPAS